MSTIKTVKVVCGDTDSGFKIINESDFVDGEHELFVEKEDSRSSSKAKEPEADPKVKPPTKAELAKLSKSELLARAEEAGIKVDVPDEVTAEQIADLLLKK